MTKTILWLCNRPFSERPCDGSGTWLSSMGQAIVASGEVQLANISCARVERAVRRDYGRIAQWVVPFETLSRNGLPSKGTIKAIRQVVDEIKPDLIHVWGTENYWGLLTAREILPGPALLDMQGIKYACARVFYGGLSLAERMHCIGPKEILMPKYFLPLARRNFANWGKFEKEMLAKHKYISTQSDWVRAHVAVVNPACTLLNTGIILRREFYEARPWTLSEEQGADSPSVFTSSADAMPYKGVHVLLRSIAILKEKYPGIVLNIAGDQLRKGIRRSGYARWLYREVCRLGITKHVRWLGALNAMQLIERLHRTSAVAIPSFVESYSMSLAEAMLVGVPVVVAHAGAMPEMVQDGVSGLVFSPGDETMCAWQLERIFRDPALASRLSYSARHIGLQRNDAAAVVGHQLDIYREVLSRSRAHVSVSVTTSSDVPTGIA